MLISNIALSHLFDVSAVHIREPGVMERLKAYHQILEPMVYDKLSQSIRPSLLAAR